MEVEKQGKEELAVLGVDVMEMLATYSNEKVLLGAKLKTVSYRKRLPQTFFRSLQT